MGDADLSDGFACWPEGLAHYIEQHDVRLPEELVQRMEARSFAAPEPQRESLVVEHRWWLDWAAANTPAPVPAPDALSFEEAARLVERLRTPLFAPCLRVGHGRWRVGLDEARVEYLPPCSAADLRRYLLSRRRVPSDAYLSAAQANRISKEVFGSSRRRPQVSRTICLMRAPPDRWFIRSGTIQEEQPRLDELGWRFTLECFRDAQPQASALDEALRRGVAGTGCQ
jgi:hypothetical protein